MYSCTAVRSDLGGFEASTVSMEVNLSCSQAGVGKLSAKAALVSEPECGQPKLACALETAHSSGE